MTSPRNQEESTLCRLNGKLSLHNFQDLHLANRIRIDLIKELDAHESFSQKGMLLATLRTSGLLATDEESDPLFYQQGKLVHFDESRGLCVREEATIVIKSKRTKTPTKSLLKNSNFKNKEQTSEKKKLQRRVKFIDEEKGKSMRRA